MSLRTVTRKARTKFDVRYESTGTPGAGGQLTKVWKMRYRNLMGRMMSLTRRHEILYFDRQKVFADYILEIPKTSRVDFSTIETRDRIYMGSRTFYIKLKKNWDERDKYLLLALTEITND